MNKVVHFELPFDNKERAKKFYSETFGWKINEMPEIGYIGADTAPSDEKGMPNEPGAINGGMVQRTADQPAPVIVISVDSIDEMVKKIETAGGTMVGEKGEVPHMGYYAYLKDTEGNVIGLWENI
ncbi:MAG: VOC family protein [Weeksellaceae bacterium]